MDVYFLVIAILIFLGLCFGSFAGAQVWRLRARQLVEDKEAGEKVNKKEYEALVPLTKSHVSNDRSRCLHCGHPLAAYDLIPLVSWISTKGRCRYCGKKIGSFEPLMEIGLAAFFVLSFIFWPEPFSFTYFTLWLIASVLLAILFAYDAKWFLLPNKIMFPFIAVSAVIALINLSSFSEVISLLGAIGVLSGIYFALWLASRGNLVGFGDVKLGLGLALLLGDWMLAFIALFAANLFGLILVLPGMLSGKIDRKTRIPFGPLLIVGAVFSFFAGQGVLSWYLTTTASLFVF